jgi:hypothetical protein
MMPAPAVIGIAIAADHFVLTQDPCWRREGERSAEATTLRTKPKLETAGDGQLCG